jgi:ribonuclease Z
MIVQGVGVYDFVPVGGPIDGKGRSGRERPEAGQGWGREEGTMFDLTFLGTAASVPSLERGLAALSVAAGPARFLIDCGEGTQRQMLRAGIGFRRLRRVLLTHNHLDHVLGLGGLIATLALFRTGAELQICGSRQTIEFVERYLAALWPAGRSPVAAELIVLEPGTALHEGDVRVVCFPVLHRGTESLGFRFETAPRRHLERERLTEFGVPAGALRGRLAAGDAVSLPDGRRIEPDMVLGPAVPGAVLAVVGDAGETRSLVAHVRGADALVIEATFLEEDAKLAAERGHLTAAQAGWLAAQAEVGTLYLTHISGRYDPAAIAAEAARYFPNIHVVNDFDRFSVGTRSG